MNDSGGSYNIGCIIGGSKVICSELNRQGYLSFDDMMASKTFANERINKFTTLGYHYWAKPLVKVMQRSSEITDLVEPLGLAWGKHMSYEMGMGLKDDSLGKLISEIGVPESQSLGLWLTKNKNEQYKNEQYENWLNPLTQTYNTITNIIIEWNAIQLISMQCSTIQCSAW